MTLTFGHTSLAEVQARDHKGLQGRLGNVVFWLP